MLVDSNLNRIEQIILAFVAVGPVKGTTLLVDVLNCMCESGIPTREHDIPTVLNSMVQQGKLVELEYVLPNMDYRIKSVYFPAGTSFPQFNKNTNS